MKINQKQLLRSSRKEMRWTSASSVKPMRVTDKKKKANKQACRKKVRVYQKPDFFFLADSLFIAYPEIKKAGNTGSLQFI